MPENEKPPAMPVDIYYIEIKTRYISNELSKLNSITILFCRKWNILKVSEIIYELWNTKKILTPEHLKSLP